MKVQPRGGSAPRSPVRAMRMLHPGEGSAKVHPREGSARARPGEGNALGSIHMPAWVLWTCIPVRALHQRTLV